MSKLHVALIVVRGPDQRMVGVDEAELDDIDETERRLLYVAYTRAREHLLLTGVTPTSEYLNDFRI